MKKALMLTVAALCLSAPAAFAEDGPGGHGKGPGKMFENNDLNKDGVVSKEEFLKGAEERFTKMDTNTDGNVTKEEAEAHHAEMKGKWKEMKDKRDADPEADPKE